MTKFICVGTYVRIETVKGPQIGIVENVSPKTQLATIKTSSGTHVRKYKDLTVISYKGVM